MSMADFSKWLAFGTGIGIEVRQNDLMVSIARLRPAGACRVASTAIARYRDRNAAEWGAEYAEFLRRHGAGHLAATVLLPRHEVIARQLALPGVPRRDLPAALALQVDSWHPFPEGEALWAWARLGDSGAVLVVITRRSTVERYAALFAEAGVKAAAFTYSGAALYSAIRLPGARPEGGFLAIGEVEGGLELYGESPDRPLYSATVDLPWERAAVLAAAELRLPAETIPRELALLLPAVAGAPGPLEALSYAAALAGAGLRRSPPANLLPAELRASGSRAIFVPTAALAALLLVVAGVGAAISPLHERRYMAALEGEIARLEPQAARAAALEDAVQRARARVRLLDSFRRRSTADLDALHELTRLLAPPIWVSSLELTPNSVTMQGEAEQAGGLLQLIDGSPLFRNSEFTSPLARTGKNEIFRIRAGREEAPR